MSTQDPTSPALPVEGRQWDVRTWDFAAAGFLLSGSQCQPPHPPQERLRRPLWGVQGLLENITEACEDLESGRLHL